jgi:hypothetical protein
VALSSNLMQHTQNQRIEDLNLVEGSDIRNHESHPSLAALAAPNEVINFARQPAVKPAWLLGWHEGAPGGAA